MIASSLQFGQIGLCDRKAGHPEPPAAQLFQELFTGDSSMKHIPLTQGKFAIVDDDMYEYLNQWKWHVNKSGETWYAVRGNWLNGVRLGAIWMHRVIMDVPQGMFIDHINHSALDNRCCNLRTCTTAQNGANRTKQKPDCFSIYKGVSKHKNHTVRKWVAKITYQKEVFWLGSYRTEIEAACAYDTKAKELFGEFARLNFPERNVRNENHSCRRKRYNTTAGKP